MVRSSRQLCGQGCEVPPEHNQCPLSPFCVSPFRDLGKKLGDNFSEQKGTVEFSILGRPKSASGPRFSESPSKTIGGTEVLVQIRCLAACFVAVYRFQYQTWHFRIESHVPFFRVSPCAKIARHVEIQNPLWAIFAQKQNGNS